MAATRDALTGSLRDAIQALNRRVHGAVEGTPPVPPEGLTESVKEVRALLAAVEQCLFHAMRTDEFQGVLPFWALLERLEGGALKPPDYDFNNSVGAVAVARALKTPYGKARGWVRQALNAKQLKRCVASVFLQQPRHLATFWEARSLLRSDDGLGVLVPILDSLEHSGCTFALAVEVADLNDKPTWPILAAEPPEPVAPPPVASGGWIPPRALWGSSNNNSSSNNSGGAATKPVAAEAAPASKQSTSNSSASNISTASACTSSNSNSSSSGGGGGGWAAWKGALTEGLFGDEETATAWKAKAAAAVVAASEKVVDAVENVKERTATKESTYAWVKERATAAAAEAEKAMDDFEADGLLFGDAPGSNSRDGNSSVSGNRSSTKSNSSSSGRNGAKERREQHTQRRLQSPPVPNTRSARPAPPPLPRGPPRFLWGESLPRLCKSEAHSELARLMPAAAVPHAIVTMCAALDESRSTPGLFRKPVSSGALQAVRSWFDSRPRGGVPPGYDPHVVAAALVACLASLRDPLFPMEHYHAVLACGSLDAKLKADAAASSPNTAKGSSGGDDSAEAEAGFDDDDSVAVSSSYGRGGYPAGSNSSGSGSGTAGAGARNLSALLMALPAANKATLAVLGRTLHNLTMAHGDGNKTGSGSSGSSTLGNENGEDDGALDFLDMSHDGPLSPMSPKATSSSSSSSSSPPRVPINGTTPLLLGLVFAPALLRSDQDDSEYDHQSAVAKALSAGSRNLDHSHVVDDDDEDDEGVVGSANALGEGGGDAVKLLVAEWPVVGAALEAEQADLKRQLAHKCLKLEAYQADLQVPLEPTKYNEHDAALRALWHALAPTDDLVMAERRAAYHARVAQRVASRATRAADKRAEKEAAEVARLAARVAAKAQARADKKAARAKRKNAKDAAAATAAQSTTAATTGTTPGSAPQANGNTSQGGDGEGFAATPAPSEEVIENVTMMGFSAEWAVHALHATSIEDSDAAVDFILEHITDMDELVAAAASTSAGPQSTVAAVPEAAPQVEPPSFSIATSSGIEDDNDDEEDDEDDVGDVEDDDEIDEEEPEEPEEAPPTEYTDPEGGGPDVASSHRFARCGLSGVVASALGSTSFAASALDELRGGGLLVVTCLTYLCKHYPHTAPRLLAHAAGRAASKARRSSHHGAGGGGATVVGRGGSAEPAATEPAATSATASPHGVLSNNSNSPSSNTSSYGSSSGGGSQHTFESRENSVDDERGVSVASVSVQCLRCVAEVLHLTPTPMFSDVSASSVARTSMWPLLDHPACVETLFALAVHVFDDWTTGGAGASSALFDLSSRMGATHATLEELVHGKRKAAKNAQADGFGGGHSRASYSGGGFTSPRDVWAAWAAGADDRVNADGELPPLPPPPPRANPAAITISTRTSHTRSSDGTNENGSAMTDAAAHSQDPQPPRPPPALAMGLASLGRFVTGAGSEFSSPPPSEVLTSESNSATSDFEGESSEF